jgi:hypothetical protein
MINIILTIIFILVTCVTCFANPFLAAIPMEDNVKYYVITIDGMDEYVPADFNMNFLYQLGYLKEDRDYLCELKAGNEDGECPPIKFIVERKSNRNWIFYTIKKIPNEVIEDPLYNERFVDTELTLKINLADIVKGTSHIAIEPTQQFIEDPTNPTNPLEEEANPLEVDPTNPLEEEVDPTNPLNPVNNKRSDGGCFISTAR